MCCIIVQYCLKLQQSAPTSLLFTVNTHQATASASPHQQTLSLHLRPPLGSGRQMQDRTPPEQWLQIPRSAAQSLSRHPAAALTAVKAGQDSVFSHRGGDLGLWVLSSHIPAEAAETESWYGVRCGFHKATASHLAGHASERPDAPQAPSMHPGFNP